MADSEDYDKFLPIRGYDPAEAYAQLITIGGTLLQQRGRFEQMTNRQFDSISIIDSRFGGVDRRLDKLEARLEDVDEKLARLLAIFDRGGAS